MVTEQRVQLRPATAEALDALRRYPREVVADIAPGDPMYETAPADKRDEAYVSHGRVMLDTIRAAMVAAKKETAQRILDLPSGHGRVLRLLSAEYPAAEVAACDIQAEAVDFCAERLGATPVYGREHPRDVELPGQFDLAWCGSLFTHLDRPMWDEFMELFERALEPGGLLVMTISGRFIAAAVRDPEWPQRFNPRFDHESGARERYLHAYETEGFAFAEYPTSVEQKAARSQPSSYGVSLVKPSWMMQLIEQRGTFQVVSYTEGRWGLMDAVALVRVERVAHPSPLRYNQPLGGLE